MDCLVIETRSADRNRIYNQLDRHGSAFDGPRAPACPQGSWTSSPWSTGRLCDCQPRRRDCRRGLLIFEELKHAETIALAQAGKKARGGTAYVSLEPHAHHGRTPPCTDALLAAGIKRVVAPIEDLNPKVSGKASRICALRGAEVQTGLLADRSDSAQRSLSAFHAHRIAVCPS